MQSRSWAGCLLLFATAGLCACQTDPLVRRQAYPSAPRVPIEEFIDQTRRSDTSLATDEEVDLVEQLVFHRKSYLQILSQLQGFYDQHGQEEKYRWASSELDGAMSVHTYHYLLDSELARLDLEPVKKLKAADKLFARAKAQAARAGHGTPALYNEAQMQQALSMFKQLIREYPHSDKIDDAAFYCGELHKEYFKGDDGIAVYWYERAWNWDAATPHPARFQAAVVYDYRLHDRERALELYRAAIAAEPQYKSNTRWAQERIEQLIRSGPIESTRTEPVAEGTAGRSTAVGQQEPPDDSGGTNRRGDRQGID